MLQRLNVIPYCTSSVSTWDIRITTRSSSDHHQITTTNSTYQTCVCGCAVCTIHTHTPPRGDLVSHACACFYLLTTKVQKVKVMMRYVCKHIRTCIQHPFDQHIGSPSPRSCPNVDEGSCSLVCMSFVLHGRQHRTACNLAAGSLSVHSSPSLSLSQAQGIERWVRRKLYTWGEMGPLEGNLATSYIRNIHPDRSCSRSQS